VTGAGPIIAAVLFGAMVVVIVALNMRKTPERGAGIAAFARSRGWTFAGPAQPLLDDVMRYDRCARSESGPLVKRDGSAGEGPWMHNTVTGQLHAAGRHWPFRAADCEYDAWASQNDGGTYRFGYLAVPLPLPPGIKMEIHPHTVGDQLVAALGHEEIRFESEEFNRAFRVTCSDRREAFAIVSPEMMEFLLKERPVPIHIASGTLCLTDGLATWDAIQLEKVVSWAQAFVSLCPTTAFEESSVKEHVT
jgi:hypothetical protein